ncbi:MAG: hypothetical protein ACJ8F7_16655 [Gemmataceae bacterium]
MERESDSGLVVQQLMAARSTALDALSEVRLNHLAGTDTLRVAEAAAEGVVALAGAYDARGAIACAFCCVEAIGALSGSWNIEGIRERELLAQAQLVREVFGNPFRPVAIDPDWLTWRDGTAVKLAQTIYDDKRFDIMPILADALHEAGCTNDEILKHCTEPGEHVRGCWVVDLILGKS